MSPSAARATSTMRSERRNAPHRRARVIGVEEVAAAAVVEVERVDAEAVHLPVALVDEPAGTRRAGSRDRSARQDARRGRRTLRRAKRRAWSVVTVELKLICALLVGCSTESSRRGGRCLLVAPQSLSFLAMLEDLGLRRGVDGRVGDTSPADGPPRAHRHAELELNLVVRGHGVLPAGRASLRALAGHADVALPRPGSRARRRVRRPRAVVGGVPPAAVARAARDRRPAPARARSRSVSSRAVSTRGASRASPRCSRELRDAETSTTRCSTPGSPTCCSPPGARSWTATISSSASTSTPRSRPSPASCAPTPRPAASTRSHGRPG